MKDAVQAHTRLLADPLAQEHRPDPDTWLSAVYDALACGVMVHDVTGRIVYANPAAALSFGMSRDDLYQQSAMELCRRALRADGSPLSSEHNPLALALHTGEPQHRVTIGVVLPSGDYRWLQVDAVPTRGLAGDVRQVVCSFADITEHKLAADRMRLLEADIITSNDLQQMLMDSVPDLIYFKDRESRYTRINLALAQLYGLQSPDDAVGKSDCDFYPLEDARRTVAREQHVLCTGQPMINQFEDVSRLDGKERWLLSTKVPLVRDGQIVGLVSISRDVTEQRQAEARLRASEESLRQLVETAPIGMCVTDATGRIELVNAYSADYGYAPEELLGQHFSMLMPPEHRAAMAGLNVFDFSTVGRTPVEWEMVTKTGERRTVLATGVAITGSDGQPKRVNFALDVTERIQAQRATQEARMAAEELAKLRSDFVATVSHELRTPLTAIIGYAELLQVRWYDLSDEMRLDHLRRIVPSATRLHRLVEDLLLLSHLELQGLGVHCASIALGRLVRQAMVEVQGSYHDQRIDSVGPEQLQVCGDPSRVLQIVMNLLDNAAKYSPDGSPIVVTWGVEGEMAALFIRDAGPGIPPTGRSRLFTRFGRLPGSPIRAGRTGTGLGLHLGRSLAEAMGGDLDLVETGPHGSTFRLRLPLACS